MKLFLGVDLGSVSTDFALIDPDGILVEREYIRTSGNPVDAIKHGLRKLKARLDASFPEGIEILGVGTTGSARDLAAKLVGADVVKNEITAHAIAATSIDPGVRTIFEIGGQDSKIIILRDGRVTDFAMNTVCAAGTGSFLDNQAERLGVAIEDFGAMALTSTTEVRIAGRCTVFAESDMIHKQQLGFTEADIANGLCEAMIRNYINNVGGGKEFLPPAFFQGGVAANQGIVAAFERELGFKVTVPPNFDVMGAIGAALLARGRYRVSKAPSSFYGFSLVDSTFDMVSYDCSDCPNLCEVVQMSIDGEVKFRWGDKCGKWTFIGEGRLEFPTTGAKPVTDPQTPGEVPGSTENCETCIPEEDETRQLTTDGVERTISCPKCNETFTFIDNGARPFRTRCPHCGVRGILE